MGQPQARGVTPDSDPYVRHGASTKVAYLGPIFATVRHTTKRQVAAMFAEERPALLPLPVEPFRYYRFGTRPVHGGFQPAGRARGNGF